MTADRRPWRLTQHAEASLVEIALWTLERFGGAQAELYEGELIARLDAIAAGQAHSRSCAVLLPGTEADLRYARAEEHFVVFLEAADQVIVVDFLHSRSDLPRRIAALDVLRGD
jgi:plasmid stabilization system protein ParE